MSSYFCKIFYPLRGEICSLWLYAYACRLIKLLLDILSHRVYKIVVITEYITEYLSNKLFICKSLWAFGYAFFKDFRSKAGLKVYVIRSDHSKCCAWCSKLAGKYVYPDVPKDVWRRHKRCTCEITYVNEKAGTYDQISYSDVQNGKEIETRKQVTRLTPEQARAKEKEVLSRIDKSKKSGIMKSGRNLERKEQNIGAFSTLTVPMQKREILNICRKYSIDTSGITFKIQRSEKLLALPFYGSTDYNNIGRIDLFPSAFSSEEELVKTILHEKCHVLQLKKHGKAYAQQNLDLMEKQAYRFERLFYSLVTKR